VTSLQVHEAVVEVGSVNMDVWLIVAFWWWMVRFRVWIVVLLWWWLVVVLWRVMKSKWSCRVEVTRATGREGRASSLKILCYSVLLWIRRISIKVTTPPLDARWRLSLLVCIVPLPSGVIWPWLCHLMRGPYLLKTNKVSVSQSYRRNSRSLVLWLLIPSEPSRGAYPHGLSPWLHLKNKLIYRVETKVSYWQYILIWIMLVNHDISIISSF
jgi:hypothetical protein